MSRSFDFVYETYITDDAHYILKETKEWCDSLEGHLRIMHSQVDWNFLTLKVMGKNSEGSSYLAWTGRVLFSSSETPLLLWLDGSQVTFLFSFGWDSDCKSSCCGISVSGLSNRWTMCFDNCSMFNRKVCVTPGDYIASLNKYQSFNQQNRTQWIWDTRSLITFTNRSHPVVHNHVIDNFS